MREVGDVVTVKIIPGVTRRADIDMRITDVRSNYEYNERIHHYVGEIVKIRNGGSGCVNDIHKESRWAFNSEHMIGRYNLIGGCDNA